MVGSGNVAAQPANACSGDESSIRPVLPYAGADEGRRMSNERDPIADLLARARQDGYELALGDRTAGSYPLSAQRLQVAAAVMLTTVLGDTPLDEAPAILDSWPTVRAAFAQAYHSHDRTSPQPP